MWQHYGDKNVIAVRYPFVIGTDDYTKRLKFYVNYVCNGQPMNIDNIHCQMSFIRSDEAGEFMAFLAESNYSGAINGASNGTISIRELLDYVENKIGKKAILSPEGEAAPYNGEPEYSINTDKAVSLGYKFTNLKDWIYDLLDFYIAQDNDHI
jgi:nucleoside-diphosphate-sugar epimerase